MNIHEGKGYGSERDSGCIKCRQLTVCLKG